MHAKSSNHPAFSEACVGLERRPVASPSMPYALYYATSPAPKNLDREMLQRLVAVHFTTEQDAYHAAALVLRGGQYVWLIEGPDVRLTAAQIEEKCRPTLEMFKRATSRKPDEGKR
jgi:hypothetical protein